MKVPFLDLKSQNIEIGDKIKSSINEVIKNTAYASGPYVEKFEQEFAHYCNAKFCIAVNSGTSALHLALLASGIKEGDEVITVPNSFIATSWAISYCGAIPVFIDVDPKTFLMDYRLIEKSITNKTKAILPVHLYGQPFEIDIIKKIAIKHNLILIEDAAQAHGAMYNGSIIGSHGNTTCFSFYPGKNLGAYGEGGAVITDDSNISERIKMLRDHGQSEKYMHEMIGYNYRMDGIQGAVLSIKLNQLNDWTKRRNNIAQKYIDGLSGIKDIQLPIIKNHVFSSFHLFVIHINNRNNLKEYLNDKGVSTGLHYPLPIHLQNAYKNLNYSIGEFKFSEHNSNNCLSLPMYPELTNDETEYVINCIKNYFS